MPSIVYNVTFTPTVGSLGTLIEYKNSEDSVWITPNAPANPTSLATYPLSLETENSYNIRVSSYGGSCTPKYKIVNVTVTSSGNCCPEGYTLSPDTTYCFQEDTVAPTIIETDYCLAVSQLNTQYSSAGTYLYDPGYTTQLAGSSTLLTTEPQWKEQAGQVLGPMNRDGVWVDSDCNGTKDPLTVGQTLIITYPIYIVSPMTVYIGIGGDNTFSLRHNGTVIVDRDVTFGGDNFNFWHVFPLDLVSGVNYLTFEAVGDGSTNDSFAAAVYNNTSGEITAATDDSELNILFHTAQLIGDPIQIAACPDDYFLDTSEGPGSYICRKITTTSSTPC